MADTGRRDEARSAGERGDRQDTGEGWEEGDEGEVRGTKRRQGMEERGFIAAAGKSSVIAL